MKILYIVNYLLIGAMFIFKLIALKLTRYALNTGDFVELNPIMRKILYNKILVSLFILIPSIALGILNYMCMNDNLIIWVSLGCIIVCVVSFIDMTWDIIQLVR